MSPKAMKLPEESRASFSSELTRIWHDPRIFDPVPWWIFEKFGRKELIAVAKLKLEYQVNAAKLQMEGLKQEMAFLQKLNKTISGFR